MPAQRDYYEVLGVAKNAADDDIKKAYRKLAMKYHPDRNQGAGAKKAEELFKEAKEAFEVLSDPQGRAAYNQYGHAGARVHQESNLGHGRRNAPHPSNAQGTSTGNRARQGPHQGGHRGAGSGYTYSSSFEHDPEFKKIWDEINKTLDDLERDYQNIQREAFSGTVPHRASYSGASSSSGLASSSGSASATLASHGEGRWVIVAAVVAGVAAIGYGVIRGYHGEQKKREQQQQWSERIAQTQNAPMDRKV